MLEIISQSEAKATGLKHFYTGIPCRKGHDAKRFTSCNKCTECSRLASVEWYSDRGRGAAKTRKWRLTNSDRHKENDRKWRANNADRVKATQRKSHEKHKKVRNKASRDWYWRNVERQRQRSVDYRNQNLDECRAKANAWGRANKPKVAALARKRRAAARGNGGTHTASDVAILLKRQKGKCGYCRIKLGDKYHVDHIMPLVLGGSNGKENLQILCAPCNQSKSAKHPIVFAQSLGMLL